MTDMAADSLEYDDFESVFCEYPDRNPSPSAEQEQPMASTFNTIAAPIEHARKADLDTWDESELLSLVELYVLRCKGDLAQAKLDLIEARHIRERFDFCRLSGFSIITDPVLSEVLPVLVEEELERRGAPEVGSDEQIDFPFMETLLKKFETIGIEYLRKADSWPLCNLIREACKHFECAYSYDPSRRPVIWPTSLAGADPINVSNAARTFAQLASDVIIKRFEQDDINRLDTDRLLADIMALDLRDETQNSQAIRWLAESFGGEWVIEPHDMIVYVREAPTNAGADFCKRLATALCKTKGTGAPVLSKHAPAEDIPPVRYGTEHIKPGDKVRLVSGSPMALDGETWFALLDSIGKRPLYVVAAEDHALFSGEFTKMVHLTDRGIAGMHGHWHFTIKDGIWEVLERGSAASV